jgi:predicted TIM-barrel enzyme
MAGRFTGGMLPYGDANGIVLEMAAEVLPVVKNVPVMAGVCGTDPFRLMPVFLKQIQEMGFSGVQNFPTVGLFDGKFRANLEATDMGYDKEVEMIASPTKWICLPPYAFTPKKQPPWQKPSGFAVGHVGLTTAEASARAKHLHG